MLYYWNLHLEFNFRWTTAGGFPLLIPKFSMLWLFSMGCISFGSIPDFWIYTFQIKQFREILLCKSIVSSYTYQSNSNKYS